MPNWVYNTMNVSGAEADVRQFIADMSKPIPTAKKDPNSTWGTLEGEWEIDENVVFSFWNVISPIEEDWAEYFTSATNTAPTNNWYAWNNTHWGTKWDGRVDETSVDQLDVMTYADGKTGVTYRFETAWAPPTPVFEAIAEQYPKLQLSIEWEEEQGFGQEIETNEDGELVITREWDIPQSHADHVEQDKLDSCNCAYDDDEDTWYDDCPRAEEDENKVIVVTDLTSVS